MLDGSGIRFDATNQALAPPVEPVRRQTMPARERVDRVLASLDCVEYDPGIGRGQRVSHS